MFRQLKCSKSSAHIELNSRISFRKGSVKTIILPSTWRHIRLISINEVEVKVDIIHVIPSHRHQVLHHLEFKDQQYVLTGFEKIKDQTMEVFFITIRKVTISYTDLLIWKPLNLLLHWYSEPWLHIFQLTWSFSLLLLICTKIPGKNEDYIRQEH